MTTNKDYKNYRVAETIGEGRFAIVYRAEKLDVHKTVALKTIKPDYINHHHLREQFRRQVQQQAKLSHPRLVRVEDLREEHGQFFIALEYLPDGDLGSYIKTHGIPTFRQSAILIADVAEVLDYLHQQHIVHGDVKPGNILLYPDPTQSDLLRAKLSDLRITADQETSLTISESFLGSTAEYLSPEEANGEALTPRSDQYALAIVAYELLTGTPPFTSDSIATTYRKHKNEPPQPPSQRNSRITRELDDVVLRALNKSPEDRYATCSDFARALRTAAANTEKKQFDVLMVAARRALGKQDLPQARAALTDALLIEPANSEAQQLQKQVQEQEEMQRHYQLAADSLTLARERARVVRQETPTYIDEANLLRKFAPLRPSIWHRLFQQWQPGIRLGVAILIWGTWVVFLLTAYIDIVEENSFQPTLVALVRTSTPIPTTTPTPTSTPIPTTTPTPNPRFFSRTILLDTSHGTFSSATANYTAAYESSLSGSWGPSGYEIELNPDGVLNLNVENYAAIIITTWTANASAYSSEEAEKIREYVQSGGGLLLMGEPLLYYNRNIQVVASVWDLTMGLGSPESHCTLVSDSSLAEGIPSLQLDLGNTTIGILTFPPSTSVFAPNLLDRGTSPEWEAACVNEADAAVIATLDYGQGKIIAAADANWPFRAGGEEAVRFMLNVLNWLVGHESQ